MESQVVVKKFGGTSVADIARIRKVAELIVKFKNSEPCSKLVVVLSAMAGETNRLLALGQACGAKPDPRELDALASTGEQVTIALLAITLQELGVPALSLTGFQAGIRTNSHFTEARVEHVEVERIEQVLDCGQVAVVAGFQGIEANGDITTLGRGGSDITAVALAAALKAKACYIYTDVDGVYSADPRICPQAKKLNKISHEEMLELASVGAKVLHPRCVHFAHRFSVPLVTLSSFDPGAGTWVVSEHSGMENALVTGVAARSDEACIRIQGIPGGAKSLSKIFSELGKQGVAVDLISQTPSSEERVDICFTTPDDKSSLAFQICDKLVPELDAVGANIDRNIAKISVVGIGIRQTTDVAQVLFETLSNEGIEVIMSASSEIRLSVVVPRKYAELAVRVLHEKLVG